MAETPITVTQEDASNPNLLFRLLRTIVDRIAQLGNSIQSVRESIKIPTFNATRSALQATGSHPINVTGLRGVLADPQPASAIRYTTVPNGLPLQGLKDSQLITVQNGSGYDLYTVIGGNPNSLFKLISGASGGNMMTTDTTQNVTGAKTWQTSVTFGDSTHAADVDINNAAGTSRRLIYQSAGVGRWVLRANNTAEGGGNAGSDFEIVALTDAGAQNSVALRITRSTGLPAVFAGQTLAGQGLPPILATAVATNQSAAIPGTNLIASAVAGLYRINWFICCTTAGNAVTVDFQYTFTFNGNTTTVTLNTVSFVGGGRTLINSANSTSAGNTIIQVDASTAIQVSTQISGALGTGRYSLFAALERLN